MRRTPEVDAQAGLEKLATYPYQVATWIDDAGYPVSVAVEAQIDLAAGTARFDAPAGLSIPVVGDISMTGSHIRPAARLRLRRTPSYHGLGTRRRDRRNRRPPRSDGMGLG